MQQIIPEIVIVNLQREKTKIFENVFSDLPNVSCETKDVTKIDTDCLVSSGNSANIMDGGIDGAIAYYYPRVRINVSKVIDDLYHGDQPVGTCVLVPTGQTVHGKPGTILAHAPTMHIPHDVSNTDNAYWAFKAVLCEVSIYNRRYPQSPIRSILANGMCSGAGDMLPEVSAKQMKLAYKHVYQQPPLRHTWDNANNRDDEINNVKQKYN